MNEFLIWLEHSESISKEQYELLSEDRKAELIADYSDDMIMEMN
jgi:hypothetical protein